MIICVNLKTLALLGAVQVSRDRSRGEGGYPKISLLITRGEGGVWRGSKSDHVQVDHVIK